MTKIRWTDDEVERVAITAALIHRRLNTKQMQAIKTAQEIVLYPHRRRKLAGPSALRTAFWALFNKAAKRLDVEPFDGSFRTLAGQVPPATEVGLNGLMEPKPALPWWKRIFVRAA